MFYVVIVVIGRQMYHFRYQLYYCQVVKVFRLF